MGEKEGARAARERERKKALARARERKRRERERGCSRLQRGSTSTLTTCLTTWPTRGLTTPTTRRSSSSFSSRPPAKIAPAASGTVPVQLGERESYRWA